MAQAILQTIFFLLLIIKRLYIAILWVVVAKFYTEKVLENQRFDRLQKI
jgi:hypothetical protein